MGKKEIIAEIDEWGLTYIDWVGVQGGKPDVTINGNLTTITHNYPAGKGMVVTSHYSVEHYGTVSVTYGKVFHHTKTFPIALLRQFHGEPCEQQSLKNGGDPYDRKRK